MNPTQVLLTIFVVMLVVLYIQSYLKPKTEYTIVQTYLDKVNVDTLYDKYPIIIYDLIQDPKQLVKSLFAYSYLFDIYTHLPANAIFCTRSKFTLVFNNSTDVPVHIISPKHKPKINATLPLEQQDTSVQYVTVNLKQNQVMIVPMQWYISGTTQCNMILLDDLLSAILKAF